jgi:hypothetical protein
MPLPDISSFFPDFSSGVGVGCGLAVAAAIVGKFGSCQCAPWKLDV